MTRWIIGVVTLAIASAGASAVAAQTPPEEQQRALRDTIVERFDVVPLTDGIALTPKTRMPDVRLIEISDGTIAINGVPVTGRELRERLGSDADAVVRLSYLDPDTRRALFKTPAGTVPPLPEPPVERASPPTPDVRERPRTRRSSGDRVRILGNVTVAENETVAGQVVAVIGSVRIDGEVGDQVVAVLGSVDLGPNAIVRGDVVSVGGNVRRAPGAEIRGDLTEISLGEVGLPIHIEPFRWGGPFPYYGGFGGVQRLIGSGFRLLLLILLSALAFVVARSTVESSAARLADNPLKAAVVGVTSWVLIGPLLVVVTIVLALTVIGIPLLFFLIPFTVILLLLMAVAGFSGTALAIGQWLRRRFGITVAPGLGEVVLGVVVILLPLVVGRLIGVAGWPAQGLALVVVASALAFEFVVWTCGFGAVLTNTFARWQARRAAGMTVPPAAPAD